MPEGWRIVSLGEITLDQRIGTTQRGTKGGITLPLLKMGNVLWGGLDLESLELIDAQTAICDGATLEPGDILFNTRNTPELVGKTALWPGRFPAAYDNNLMRIRLGNETDSRFVAAWMGSPAGQSAIGQFVCASTSVGAVYWRDLTNLAIPLPSRVEQTRIARLLDEWDDAIETAGQLAIKQRRLYQTIVRTKAAGAGAMTQLRHVAEIVPCESSVGVKDAMAVGSPLFTAGGKAGLFHPPRSDGDAVILSAIGSRCGKCFFAEGRWTAGANTIVIAADPQRARFLFHYLETVRPWLIQGSGQPYISPANAGSTPVPNLSSDQMAELGALFDELLLGADLAHQRLSAICRQKRGLMQKLLAGEWRVPTRGDAFGPTDPASDCLAEIAQ